MQVRPALADIPVKGLPGLEDPAEFQHDGFLLLDLEGTKEAVVNGGSEGKKK